MYNYAFRNSVPSRLRENSERFLHVDVVAWRAALSLTLPCAMLIRMLATFDRAAINRALISILFALRAT